MPTYEYTCPKCGHEFERFCKLSERLDQKCSKCDNIGRQQVRTPAKPNWLALAMGESASPEAIKRFDKMHRDKRDKEDKAVKEHGSYD